MKRYKYKWFYWFSGIGYFVLAAVFGYMAYKETSPFESPLDVISVLIFIILGFQELWQYKRDHM